MELVSLLVAFCIFFVAVPAVVAAGPVEGSWPFRCAAGFVRVSLFFRIAVMVTGLAGANFAGIFIALWMTWTLGLAAWSQRGTVLDLRLRWQAAFLRILQRIETGPGVVSWPRLPAVSRFAALFFALAAAVLLHRAWFPLHNLRFSNIETYSRALDLLRFMDRDTPLASGGALLLAPLSVFSGLYADSVIRFSGPLFSTLLVLAVALCAFRWIGSPSGALVAAALIAAWPAVTRRPYPGEISNAEIAAVYWVLGAVFAGRSTWLTVYACGTAMLVSWTPSVILLPAAICIGLGYLFARFLSAFIRSRSHWIPAGAVAAAATLLLLVDCRADMADGPFEYEAAARACRSIAGRFPRNEWLIVSPVHELVFTYGRGWHLELVDFVTSHSVGQITPEEFSFPYDVPDIFVFVEKHPLRSGLTPDMPGFGAFDLTQTMDRAVLAYSAGPGRASIEFKAAALLSGYGMNHAVSVFQEDERLVVFHLKGKRPPM